MTAAIVIFLIAAVLILLAWMPIDCIIHVIYKDNTFSQEVYFKVGWITIKPKSGKKSKSSQKKKKAKKESTSEKSFSDKIYQELKRFKKIYFELKDEFFEFFSLACKKGVCLKETSIYLGFGMEDAAQTGIMVGVANAVVYNLLSVLDRLFNIKKMEVNIQPDFQKQFIDAAFSCIAGTKIAHIIPIGFKGLRLFRKSMKLYKESKQNEDE